MKVTTYEATVENGQVRLPEDAHIPDHTRVYVVVPSAEPIGRVRIASPHLAHPEDAADFVKQVEEVPDDAHV
jgi:hypothetical protein